MVFHPPAAADGGDWTTFVATESKALGEDVAVTLVKFAQEAALGSALAISEQAGGATIIGDTGQQETVCLVLTKHRAKFCKVATQQAVGLGFRDGIA